MQKKYQTSWILSMMIGTILLIGISILIPHFLSTRITVAEDNSTVFEVLISNESAGTEENESEMRVVKAASIWELIMLVECAAAAWLGIQYFWDDRKYYEIKKETRKTEYETEKKKQP